MGGPKQTLPYGSTTLVGSAVAVAQASIVDDVVVVTGFHGPAVSAAVQESARVVENPDPAAGNMSSLMMGLDALEEGSGVVVLLSDMPEVSIDVVDALIEGVHSSGADAGWVAYSNGDGHPIFLMARILEEVRDLTGPKALWRYLVSLPPDRLFVLEIDAPRPIDVNTADDYEAVIRRLQSRDPDQG
ncbi:MAG: NTP transferase domain-containing protein [Proteobacteria bacterium]|nr:NTP transferase domain-containing protein [Pseudomonadota bacterium]